MEVYRNCVDHLRNNLSCRKSLYLIFSNSSENKQKPITNSCRNNLWSKPILILSKTEFKVFRNKPGDKAFRVSLKLPRRG